MSAPIHKVGAAIIRGDRILLCRKQGKLILPGGKIEAGETELACLTRELREELGDVAFVDPVKFGTFDHATPKPIRIELYLGRLNGEPVASGEIEAIEWFGPASDAAQLIDSLREAVLPALLSRGVLRGAFLRGAFP